MGLLNVLRTIALAIGLVVGFSGIRNIAAATKRVAPTCAEILAERALEAISSTRLTPNEAWSKLKKDLELASGPTVLLTSFSISANVSMAMLMELGKLAASLGVEVDFELSTANAVRTKTSSIIYQNFVFSGPAAKIAKLMTSIASKPFVETLTLRHSEVLNALVDEPLILPALKTLDSTSEKNQNELYKVAFEKAAQAPVLLIDQPGRFSVLVASEIFDRWAKNSKVASAFKVHRTTLSDMAKSLNGLGAIDRHSKRGVYQVSDPTSKNQIYVISMDVFSILQREAADGVLGESEPAVLREKIRSLLKVETQQIAPILEDLPIEAPAKPSIAELKSAKTKAERRTETISGKQSLSISAFIFLNNKQNLLISPAGVVIEKQGSGPNGVQRNRATIPRAVYFAARPELDAQYVVEQIQKHLERYDASLVLSHDQVEQLREPIARLLSDPAPSDIQLIPNDPNGRLRRLNELTLGTERPPVLLKRASSGIYGLLIPIAPVPEVAKSTATAESIEPGPVTQAPMTSDRTHLGSPTQDLVGQMELIRPGMEISEIGPKTILGRFKPFREFLNRPETYLDGLMGDPKTSTAGAPFLVLTRRSVNSTAESPYLVLFSESYFGAATEELLFAQYRYALQLGEGESLTGGLQRRFLDELLGERTRNAEVMTAKALRSIAIGKKGGIFWSADPKKNPLAIRFVALPVPDHMKANFLAVELENHSGVETSGSENEELSLAAFNESRFLSKSVFGELDATVVPLIANGKSKFIAVRVDRIRTEEERQRTYVELVEEINAAQVLDFPITLPQASEMLTTAIESTELDQGFHIGSVIARARFLRDLAAKNRSTVVIHGLQNASERVFLIPLNTTLARFGFPEKLEVVESEKKVSPEDQVLETIQNFERVLQGEPPLSLSPLEVVALLKKMLEDPVYQNALIGMGNSDLREWVRSDSIELWFEVVRHTVKKELRDAVDGLLPIPNPTIEQNEISEKSEVDSAPDRRNLARQRIRDELPASLRATFDQDIFFVNAALSEIGSEKKLAWLVPSLVKSLRKNIESQYRIGSKAMVIHSLSNRQVYFAEFGDNGGKKGSFTFLRNNRGQVLILDISASFINFGNNRWASAVTLRYEVALEEVPEFFNDTNTTRR